METAEYWLRVSLILGLTTDLSQGFNGERFRLRDAGDPALINVVIPEDEVRLNVRLC